MNETSAVYIVPSYVDKAVHVTPDGVVYYPRWSPDGNEITFMTSSSDEPEFYLISNFMNF